MHQCFPVTNVRGAHVRRTIVDQLGQLLYTGTCLRGMSF